MHSPLHHAPGFNEPHAGKSGRGRLDSAIAHLIATVTLAAGTLVAVTALSIGVARADPLATVIHTESGVLAFAAMLGALLLGASVTKAVSPRRNARRDALRASLSRDRPPQQR